MKQIVLFLSTLAAFMSISAMEKPEIKPVAKEKITPVASTVYYTPEHLQRLYAQGVQRHAPCLVLFDPENADLENQSLLNTLNEAIIQEFQYPIIASTVVVYNLLAKVIEAEKNPTSENSEYQNFPLTIKNWNLYITPYSNFFIFIPKKFSQAFPELGIKIKSLANRTHLLPGAFTGKEKVSSFNALYEEASDFPSGINSNFYDSFFKDFSRIFFTKEELDAQKLPIWDFILDGHGLAKPRHSIAGMPPDELNKILSFFDSNLNVGTVVILSCMAGGENLNFLEFENWGAKKNHPYIIFVSSISDSPRVSTAFIKSYDNFFNLAAQLSDKGESLSQLLIATTNIGAKLNAVPVQHMKRPLSRVIRKSEGIAQVWLPNGMGFTTFNVDQSVLVLGKVMARIALENGKPIIIRAKKVVLVYPQIIQAPLYVSPVTEQNVNPELMNVFFAKNIAFKDLPLISEPSFWHNLSSAKRSELDRILRIEYPLAPKGYEKTEFSYIYPEFISMMRGDTTQIISYIQLGQSPATGVIRFIRDAFLDIAHRTSRKTFLIENLTGYNDISLLLQAARISKDISQMHPLETQLAAQKNLPITLTNMLITTQYDILAEKDIFSVTFSADGGRSAWQFTSDDVKNIWPQTILWNFRQIDPIGYWKIVSDLKQQLMFQSHQPNIYEQLPQKSISQVLKQKQEAIMLKKAVELKQREAATTKPAQEELKK